MLIDIHPSLTIAGKQSSVAWFCQVAPKRTQVFNFWPPNASRRKLVSVFSIVQTRVQDRTEMVCWQTVSNLRVLARLFGYPLQVDISKPALTCDSVWPGL